MWSTVAEELLEELTNTQIEIVLTCRNKYEKFLCDRIQGKFRIVSNWCRMVGLDVNPVKTAVVLFTRKRKLNYLRAISLVERNAKQDARTSGPILVKETCS